MEDAEITVYALNMAEHEQARQILKGKSVTVSNLLIQVRASTDQIKQLQDKGLLVQINEYKLQGTDAQLASVSEPNLNPYVLLTLRGPLLNDQKKQLLEFGVELLEHQGRMTYRAHIPLAKQRSVTELSFVETVRPYDKEATPLINLVEGTDDSSDQAWDISLQRPSSMEGLKSWLQDQEIPVQSSSESKLRVVLESGVGREKVDLLRAHQEVAGVARVVPPNFSNDLIRKLIGPLGPVPPSAAAIFSYRGNNQYVAVADSGIDSTHPDLQTQISGSIPPGLTMDDVKGHGTHVAGTIAACNNVNVAGGLGVAPGVKLLIQSIVVNGVFNLPMDLKELFQAAYDQGARIHNNSWGAAGTSEYDDEARETDEFVAKHPDFVVICAAGNKARNNPENSGHIASHSIDSPATAKNVITVGASCSTRTDGPHSGQTYADYDPTNFFDIPTSLLRFSGEPDEIAAFSGRGPCKAGWIKPDLVAPGTDVLSTFSSRVPGIGQMYSYETGTSMAAPVVSGAAALVREYYVSDCHHTPSAALVKATLIAGAIPLQGESAGRELGLPNIHQGFGRVSLATTLPNKSQVDLQLCFLDTWLMDAPLSQTGAVKKIEFSIRPSQTPLRVCLTYTDPAGAGLQNNLNLILIGPDKIKRLGNPDRQGENTIMEFDNQNCVERILLESPLKGLWDLYIIASNLISPQHFAVVMTGAISQISR